jgi:hypothetical protein
VKCERIEHRILELLNQYEIRDYFFLDSSFPMIRLLAKEGEKKVALRYSEFEGLDTLEAMQGKVDWVWVDCFTRVPLNGRIYRQIKQLGYQTCFVSPELQGRPQDVVPYIQQLEQEGIVYDAVCSKLKYISEWEKVAASCPQ